MVSSGAYSYLERSTFDINNLVDVIRFIIVNTILAFIFLFLLLEEIDWFLLSSKEIAKDKIIDNTSWNIKKIF